MKVTIALITYNRPKYLSKAINAILNQTYTNFEFLILDNGSTEETKQVISQFKDRRIKYLRNDINQREFYNKAFEIALGEYLLITHDDDIMLPELLRMEVEAMDNYPNSVIISCNAQSIDEDDNITNQNLLNLKFIKIFQKYEYILNFIRNKKGIICPTALMRKSYFLTQKIKFDIAVGPGADNYLWIICNLNKSLIIIPEILYKYRIHNKQDSIVNELQMNSMLNESLIKLFNKERLFSLIPILLLRLMIINIIYLKNKHLTKREYFEKIKQIHITDISLIQQGLLNIIRYLILKIPFLMLPVLKIKNRIDILLLNFNLFHKLLKK